MCLFAQRLTNEQVKVKFNEIKDLFSPVPYSTSEQACFRTGDILIRLTRNRDEPGQSRYVRMFVCPLHQKSAEVAFSISCESGLIGEGRLHNGPKNSQYDANFLLAQVSKESSILVKNYLALSTESRHSSDLVAIHDRAMNCERLIRRYYPSECAVIDKYLEINDASVMWDAFLHPILTLAYAEVLKAVPHYDSKKRSNDDYFGDYEQVAVATLRRIREYSDLNNIEADKLSSLIPDVDVTFLALVEKSNREYLLPRSENALNPVRLALRGANDYEQVCQDYSDLYSLLAESTSSNSARVN